MAKLRKWYLLVKTEQKMSAGKAGEAATGGKRSSLDSEKELENFYKLTRMKSLWPLWTSWSFELKEAESAGGLMYSR